MKYYIFVNCLEYGPKAKKVEWVYPKFAYYLGNNVDLDRCRKKDVKSSLMRIDYLRKKFKDRYCFGHRELQSSPRYIFKADVMLCNGDSLFWGDNACDVYASHNESGLGAFQRMFGRSRPSPKRITNQFLKAIAYKAVKFNVKTIICGYHGRKKLEFFHKGTRVVVLPRGRHEVDL